MPSPEHEAPLELIRNRAEFGVELLSEFGGVPVPDHHSVIIDDSDLSDALPKQLLADTVLVLRDADGTLGLGALRNGIRVVHPSGSGSVTDTAGHRHGGGASRS